MNFVFTSGKTEPIYSEIAERRFIITPAPQPIDTAPKDSTDIPTAHDE